MSFVSAVPGALGAASTELVTIGSAIGAANALAAGPTTAVMAAAGDQVSAAVAALFSSHAHGYQAIGAQLDAFHRQFVGTLHGGASSYALAEAANVSPMQQLLNLVDGTGTGTRTGGHPLIGGDTAVPEPHHGAAPAAPGASGGQFTGTDAANSAGEGHRVCGGPAGVLCARGGSGGFGVGGTGSSARNGNRRTEPGLDKDGGLLGDRSSVVVSGLWETRASVGDVDATNAATAAVAADGAQGQPSPTAEDRCGTTLLPRQPRQRWVAWRERERRDALARPSRQRSPQWSTNTLRPRNFGATRALPQPAAFAARKQGVFGRISVRA